MEEEVVYIITPKEKEVFLLLESDREREIFIEAFWKQRQPVPGAPQNEFKKEHYRRLDYVNRMYGRKSSIPGWRTDRGRVYIILGPPMNVQKFESFTKVYPTEIWYYQQDIRAGLPPFFYIVFFDRKGHGEYVLYSPVNDGPQSLLIEHPDSPLDYKSAYQELRDFNPFLAQVSISLVPGETPNFYQPSMASDMLIQKIDRIPQEETKDIYAEKFIKFKDIVEVEYSSNYFGNENLVYVTFDDAGISFINYLIQLDRLSINQIEDAYYTTLEINGIITTLQDKMIYQFEKQYPLKLNLEEFEDLKKSSFAIYDIFPLIPGDYKFSLLLKNVAAKEFTSFEKIINIPFNSDQLWMTPPLLAHDLKENIVSSSSLVPFQFNKRQLICQANKIFLKDDILYVFFQIHGIDENLRKNARISFIIYKSEEEFLNVSKKLSEFSKTGKNILVNFSLKDFSPDYYKLVISVLNQNSQQILTSSEYFSVTPIEKIARPKIVSKVLSSSKESLISYIQGIQLFNKGNQVESSKLLEKAYHANPNNINFALALCKAYESLKYYEKIESILLPFLNNSQPKFELFYTLARTKQKQADFQSAIKYYEKVVSHFGLSRDILNSLGYCHYSLGNISEAQALWKKSIDIDKNQPEIQRLLKSIEKK